MEAKKITVQKLCAFFRASRFKRKYPKCPMGRVNPLKGPKRV